MDTVQTKSGVGAAKVPRFDLHRVHAAAQGGDVVLTRKRCLDILTPLLHEYARCHAFAADVAAILTLDDFSDTISTMGRGEEFDVYGVRLPEALCEGYGLGERRNWYVKLRLEEQALGDSIFYISLHGLEWPIRRNGGLLEPDW